jgi:hypothetical protein
MTSLTVWLRFDLRGVLRVCLFVQNTKNDKKNTSNKNDLPNTTTVCCLPASDESPLDDSEAPFADDGVVRDERGAVRATRSLETAAVGVDRCRIARQARPQADLDNGSDYFVAK